jgi:hypothetical protein
LTEIYLCHACSYHEILRMGTPGQAERSAHGRSLEAKAEALAKLRRNAELLSGGEGGGGGATMLSEAELRAQLEAARRRAAEAEQALVACAGRFHLGIGPS